eukprot:scaffold24_cov245-Pinguiococcus_pyrenoidosus.AAC.13
MAQRTDGLHLAELRILQSSCGPCRRRCSRLRRGGIERHVSDKVQESRQGRDDQRQIVLQHRAKCRCRSQ